MPRNPDIQKVLVIGSGPIIIGQAAEFDYAGTQACLALREEGVEVVLVNSNPATIMTDPKIADHVYIEPLNIEFVTKIIAKERPDSILPTLGGQTGLNLAMALNENGTLAEYGVRLLGTSAESIRRAEDRQGFKDTMEAIGQPCVTSKVVESVEDAVTFAEEIGLPVIVRPAYTLGGTGGGIAENEEALREIAANGIRLSRVGQVLIERCISGWKEIEYEVIRDGAGNVITVCNMENLDPVGVHTGDSIVVAPSQTLADREYQMLRSAALDIISALEIEGGCNVQFALNPDSFEYAVIEVNPRVSRSSALASKATGYPIAKVAAKIALGYRLDEIPNAITGKTWACFEPVLDYCVVKIPKWPFDKFVSASRKLGTQMKATGEVMAIDNCFEGALMKAVRSLEQHVSSLHLDSLKPLSMEEIRERLARIDDQRLFVMAEALRRGIEPEEIHAATKVDLWFLDRLQAIVDMEKRIASEPMTGELLREAKKMGFPDAFIGELTGTDHFAVKALRDQMGVKAVFKMVDTCAAEFDAATPYYYSTYDEENEAEGTEREKKVLVLGSGPIRIGQGIEFDFCSVHSVWSLKKLGCYTIIVNNNPETVSTDFDVADKLYLEPLTPEDVQNIVELEKPWGAVVQFGGQTAIKLTEDLTNMGVRILGTDAAGVDAAEDREKFDEILKMTGIEKAEAGTCFTAEEGRTVANRIGYPVLVRPSYVLGGQGMQIAYNDKDMDDYIAIINLASQEHPILVDKYLMGRELEVDAVCDGEDILIPGIMEHIERAGIHSGDSISVYPPVKIEKRHQAIIADYARRLAAALHVVGLVNIQFVLFNDKVYVIEVNPRSSRTVPYITKVTGVPIIELATRVMLGEKLRDLGYGTGLYPESPYYAVKMPVFSFSKLTDVDTALGPEMKSTGEVLGVDRDFHQALLKAFMGVGLALPGAGDSVLLTVRDEDKPEILPIAQEMASMGMTLFATGGTHDFLRSHGVSCARVNRIAEGSPSILELVESGTFDLIVNTPGHDHSHNRDGFLIRRAAVERSIPVVTAIDTAQAVVHAKRLGHRKQLHAVDIAGLRDETAFRINPS